MSLPTVTIRGRTFTILFPDLFRPLTGAERARLKSHIRRHGVRVPVVIDENNGVIDGINRVTIAAELGAAAIPVQVEKGLTDEQKVELAHTLNDARRHLTAKDR